MKKILIPVIALAVAAATVFALQSPGVRERVASIVTPAREVIVPEGTTITVRLDDRVSTNASHANDPFHATVAEPVRSGDDVVIPGGSEVSGHVIYAEPAGHIKGRGELQLALDRVEIGPRGYDLDARSKVYASRSAAKRSAGLIGGGAVLGGLVGGMTGHSGGSAVKGAVIGGAAGTAASMASGRPELAFGPGALLSFRLDREVRLRVRAA